MSALSPEARERATGRSQVGALTKGQRQELGEIAHANFLDSTRVRGITYGDLRALLSDLADAERGRDEAREIIGEYLSPICEAFECVQKIERHPPGAGINDPDYPGPTDDEVEAYDDELMAARNDLTEAIQTACDAQEDVAPAQAAQEGGEG